MDFFKTKARFVLIILFHSCYVVSRFFNSHRRDKFPRSENVDNFARKTQDHT